MEERETTSDEAHDVLAADEFAMPAADPELHHHGPVRLPGDPGGEGAPHDILAAEEFPMPAPPRRPASVLTQRRGGAGRLLAETLAALLLLALLRRRHSR